MAATTTGALRDGIARVYRAPGVLACVYLVTLLTAIPFSLAMRAAISTHLGSSLVAEHVARGVHVQWWSEFAARSGALGSTFQTTIIGFAAVLDNVSNAADAIARPSPLLWLGALYLLVWLFLTGGILDRYARARATNMAEFFTACSVCFVRFLRLAPFVALAYYALFAVIHPLLFGNVYGALTRDVTAERTAFFIRLALYVVFGLLLGVFSVVFDYAKVRAVVEDRRSMIGALLGSVQFVSRNAGSVAALYLMNAGLFVAVLLIYALLAPGAGWSGAAIWGAFGIGQLFLLGRLWARLVFFASETSLFQHRLAHIGFIAQRNTVPREPPIVEMIVES